MAACVYSSDGPTPNPSGQGADTSQSADGTDPASGGSTGGTGGTGSTGADAGAGGGGGGTGTDAGGGGGGGGGGIDSGGGGGTPTAPTWTEIYNGYFAASSVGQCGKSGCHSGSKGGFKCGTTAATCYAGVVSAGFINTGTPSSSMLIDKSQSPLEWFGGNMPSSGGSNATAVKDITAWVNAGAPNN